MKSKAFEMIKHGVKIAYLLDQENNVMINAADMAKAYGRRLQNYLDSKKTQDFILALVDGEKPVSSSDFRAKNDPKLTGKPVSFDDPLYEKVIKVQSGNPTLFCEQLAYDFAAWLDPYFRVWMTTQITKQVRANIESVNSIQLEIAKLERRAKYLEDLFMTDPQYRELVAIKKRIQHLKSQTGKSLKEGRELTGKLFDTEN